MTNLPASYTGPGHRSLFGKLPRFAWRRFSDGVELKATAVFPKNHSRTDKAPAVFFFHGGMWKIGDPTEFTPWALHLAERGIVSVLFEYRQTQNYDVSGPAILDDAAEAWEWMQSNASSMGIDPEKMAAAGSDAGGLMALLLAMKHEKPRKKIIPPPVPAALIIFRGIVDCTKKSALFNYFPSEKEAKLSSPLYRIRKNLPPLFSITGGKDRFISSDQAGKFARIYRRKKNKASFHLLEAADQTFYHFNINASLFEYSLLKLLDFLAECEFIAPLSEEEGISLIQ